MHDAESALSEARRPLVIGIGGGGDVVGALATAELCRIYNGADPVVGGVTWERRVIDPEPGPRRLTEVEGAELIGETVALAGPDTRAGDVVFAEAHMARFLGKPTVLVDPNDGAAAIAEDLMAAANQLGCDLLVFVDVGGDVLAAGGEPGLSSPLCDAVLLAAAARIQRTGAKVIGGVFGIGCDGELTFDEVMARLAELGTARALGGVRGLTAAVAYRLEQAVREVPTEASALAIRAFHGETGNAEIRGGRRTVALSPACTLTFYFDPTRAIRSAAPLALAVADAKSLEEANGILNELGVTTELDLEREFAAPSH
ncbi:MAG: DUF1152 domain-containing protein [Thermoleophilaceae bacterium]